MITQKVGSKRISLLRGDITQAKVDAFVYDITSDCKLGSGFGGAIMMRGGKVVQDELNKIGICKTGEAIVTSAGELEASMIIYVNGPKFHEPETEKKLKIAVQAALKVAEEREAKTVAFPLLGTGLYQVPVDLSVNVMCRTIQEHLAGTTTIEEVQFVVNDSREYDPIKACLGGNHHA